jgi:hypothetical protein
MSWSRLFHTTAPLSQVAWNPAQELEDIERKIGLIRQSVRNITDLPKKTSYCALFMKWMWRNSTPKEDPFAQIREPTKCLVAANQQLGEVIEGLRMDNNPVIDIQKIASLRKKINALWDEIGMRANRLGGQAYCE